MGKEMAKKSKSSIKDQYNRTTVTKPNQRLALDTNLDSSAVATSTDNRSPNNWFNQSLKVRNAQMKQW